MANSTIEFDQVIRSKEVDSEITDAVKRENIDMIDVDGITTTGSGNKFLSDNGTYKIVTPDSSIPPPAIDDQLRKYDTDGSVEYISVPGGGNGDVEWGDIGGVLSNQNDLQDELDDKAPISHTSQTNNPHNVTKNQVGLGSVDNTSDMNKPISTATQNALNTKSSLNHAHEIVDVNGLQTSLDNKIDDGDAYLKSEYINTSTGSGDSGKPIVLNANGTVDDTMINISGYYPVGNFTPTAGSEYPDITGENPGATWNVDGVDDTLGYTFTGGDLNGDTAFNGDRLVNGTDAWVLDRKANFDEDLFYKRDGSQPITAAFDGGGHQVKNIADGSDDQDAVTMKQMNSFSGGFVKVDGTSTMTGNLNYGGMKSVNIAAGSSAGDGVEYDQFSSGISGRAPINHDHTISDVTDLQNELSDKASNSDLTSHIGDNTDPHNVTKDQVGLGFVIDNGDGTKYLANDGMYKDVSTGSDMPFFEHNDSMRGDNPAGTDYRIYTFDADNGNDPSVFYGADLDGVNSKHGFRGSIYIGGQSSAYATLTDSPYTFSIYNETSTFQWTQVVYNGGAWGLVRTTDNDTDFIDVITCYSAAGHLELGSDFLKFNNDDILPPRDSIVMYTGDESDLSSSWYVCDGSHGTPDMTSEFKEYSVSGDTVTMVYIQYKKDS